MLNVLIYKPYHSDELRKGLHKLNDNQHYVDQIQFPYDSVMCFTHTVISLWTIFVWDLHMGSFSFQEKVLYHQASSKLQHILPTHQIMKTN